MNNKIRVLELRMISVFILLVSATSLIMMTVLTYRSNHNLKKYVSGLVDANGRQIEWNIDTYLRKIEKNASLLFAEESAAEYNKADSELSDYDRIQLESRIEDRIIDMSLMDNYTDFAVIYPDDSNIGWVSKNTRALFPERGLYDTFSSAVSTDAAQNGWTFYSIGELSRIYYIKRLNENALILVSFYGTELDSAFEVPDVLKNMTIRLTTPDDQIVHSTDHGEIGIKVPDYLRELLGDEGDGIQTVMDEKYLVTEHICTNRWKVICSIPSDTLMKDNNLLYRSSVILVLALSAAAMGIGFLFYYRLSRKMNSMVGEIEDQANSDRMTGLLNKTAFMSMVSEELEAYTGKQANCFIMIDIDNFKQINDQMGHAKGDEVIIRMAEIIREVFGSEMKLGRIGGDEFAVYISFTRIDRAQAEQMMRALVEKLFSQLRISKLTDGDVQISVSCGAVIIGPGEYTYEELYRCADKMLYLSKESGKNRASFAKTLDDSAGGIQ